MAYAALVSLKLTIERLVNSSHVSVVPPCPETELVYEEVGSFLRFLKRISSSESRDERVIAYFDAQIRDAVIKLEDALESHVTHQFVAQSEKNLGDHDTFSIHLEEVREEIYSFLETAKKIKEEYNTGNLQLSKFLREDGEEEAVLERKDYWTPMIIGVQEDVTKLREMLITNELASLRGVAILGMVGIGKTTLAEQFFEDPVTLSHFRSRVWTTIYKKFKKAEIKEDFLAQAGKPACTVAEISITQLHDRIKEYVQREMCLIVLDDVWEEHLLKELHDFGVGSGILLTTRLQEVASFTCWSLQGGIHERRFLSEEESWCLFHMAFACVRYGETQFPDDGDKIRDLHAKVLAELRTHGLDEVGKKIIQNCEGLPLAIIVVCKHLSQVEMTVEYWNQIAERKFPFSLIHISSSY